MRIVCRQIRRTALFFVVMAMTFSSRADETVLHSARSGAWSSAETWEGGKLPIAGAKVQIRPGHAVIFDMPASPVIRSIHIGGVLRFATDRDTLLNVCLLKIQNGENATESGFDCGPHPSAGGSSQAALEVGTTDKPVDANHTATIRLTYIEGMDKTSFPALVCCGGKMDFHGAPLSRSWVKLGENASAGAKTLQLADPVMGWRIGDHIIITASERQSKEKKTFMASVRDRARTEDRVITALKGQELSLDKPLEFDHAGPAAYRVEVADLSRNVVVESAEPAGVRGHTMYHHGSSGSISYAEFRHLGKSGQLGRYSLHFHLAGDSMRGSSVIGASIWDSANRWLTIHGTNYLVVRDCVGYQSKGHGFFLEDGTEVNNILDGNLAVQAFAQSPLKDQVFPFDQNDGSGFWWANSGNSFTRNVAVECDEYGYFFQAPRTPGFDLSMNVEQPDGTSKNVDIRTLPFIRFDGNEAHTQRRHAFNLGGGVPFGPGVAGVGPDARHPFIIRNMHIWDVHWAFNPVSPSVLVENMDISHADYGVWRPVYKDHAYRHITMADIHVNPEFSPTGQKPVEAAFPKPLDPVDDQPPVTVITGVRRAGNQLHVRGVATDNGQIKRITIDGVEAKSISTNFADWEATVQNVPAGGKLTAFAEDETGNVEKRVHETIAP